MSAELSCAQTNRQREIKPARLGASTSACCSSFHINAMKIKLQCACVLVLWLSALVHGQARKPEVLVQVGHSEVIMSVAFSPDGRICASGSRDQTIKLWDTQTGRLLRTLMQPTPLASLAFSPDGRRLGASTDSTALDNQVEEQKLAPESKDKDQTRKPRDKEAERPTLWDVQSGQVLARLAGCQTVRF